MNEIRLSRIATIHTDFPDKFGIPRQSGLADSLKATITFEEGFGFHEAVRGLEGYSHIWLLWLFENGNDTWHPTVRPPRLGGNTHMGVFATRSPFRPNPIGLSCVRLEAVEMTKDGPVLHIAGADLRDKTAILDIKPYLPYADAHPEAKGGFAQEAYTARRLLQVEIDDGILQQIEPGKRKALLEILAEDPRPAYQSDPDRIYGVSFAGCNIRFRVQADTLIVLSAEKTDNAVPSKADTLPD
ncbi:MAG: tRNA (N6-threonylcarbamoyladenosine(37)-N6)-methyltransferase TrmO [Lachnospiraceae bacterium]|nr:tRNA (N6-threonylcarbamoyladenosine(37)-N6)-methyltransferase TrmO [Lachnospiraceae bacterium]